MASRKTAGGQNRPPRQKNAQDVIARELRQVRTTCRVNLRRGPSMETSVLRVLETGERLELLADFTADGWANVRAGGEIGFVMTAYLKEVT